MGLVQEIRELAYPFYSSNYPVRELERQIQNLLSPEERREFVNKAEAGTTPLAMAIKMDRPDIVVLLLHYGADISVVEDGLAKLIGMHMDGCYQAMIDVLQRLPEITEAISLKLLTEHQLSFFISEQCAFYESFCSSTLQSCMYADACVQVLETGQSLSCFFPQLFNTEPEMDPVFEREYRRRRSSPGSASKSPASPRDVRAFRTEHFDEQSDVHVEKDVVDCELEAEKRAFIKTVKTCLRESQTKFSALRRDICNESALVMVCMALKSLSSAKRLEYLNRALAEAILNANNRLVTLLIENGADPSSVYHTQPCVHLAVANGCSTHVLALMLKKCDATPLDTRGNTPLHTAAHTNRTDVVDLLVAYDRAMPFHKNVEGQSAVDMAAQKYSYLMGRQLLAFSQPESSYDMIKSCSLVTCQLDTGFFVAYLQDLIEKNMPATFFRMLTVYENHIASEPQASEPDVRNALASLFCYRWGLLSSMLEYQRFAFLETLAECSFATQINFQELFDQLDDALSQRFLFQLVSAQLRAHDDFKYLDFLMRFQENPAYQTLLFKEVEAHLTHIDNLNASLQKLIEQAYKPYQLRNASILSREKKGIPVAAHERFDAELYYSDYQIAVTCYSSAQCLLEWHAGYKSKLSQTDDDVVKALPVFAAIRTVSSSRSPTPPPASSIGDGVRIQRCASYSGGLFAMDNEKAASETGLRRAAHSATFGRAY